MFGHATTDPLLTRSYPATPVQVKKPFFTKEDPGSPVSVKTLSNPQSAPVGSVVC